MNTKDKSLSQLIKARRSIGPSMFSEVKVEEDKIVRALEMANWAPNHGNTEPWRFDIITGSSKQRFAEFAQLSYKSHTPEASFKERKYLKLAKKALRSSHIIAICMINSGKVPEWEEIAAVGAAVQNLWLCFTEMGISGYWSSPKVIIDDYNAFRPLEQQESCLGFFYLGYVDTEKPPESSRKPIEEKLKWFK